MTVRKLLLISPVYPYPVDRGQRVRITNILRAAANSFEVTLVCPPPDPDAGCPLGSNMKQEAAPEVITVFIGSSGSTQSTYLDVLRNAIANREILGRGRLAALRPYIDTMATVDLTAFDLVWVERRDLAVLAQTVAGRTIVDLDDVEHRKHFRELQFESSTLRRLRQIPRGLRLMTRETLGLRRYLASVVCSQDDKRYLERLGVRTAYVLPNGAELVDSPANIDRGRDGVFIGNLGYAPNVDALEWFEAEILPRIRAARPDFVLDVIGNIAGAAGRFGDGIRLRGYVDNLPAALAEYKVGVAPLRLGGGTKLKVLDAMAARLPLVTTPVGAEGLDIEPGVHALIEAEADGFARALLSLYDDPERAAALGGAGRAHIEARFDWAKIRERLTEWLMRQSDVPEER